MTLAVLQWKRKKFKAEIYEIKLKDILEDYKKDEMEEDEINNNDNFRLHKKTYESLYYCFSQVLRRKDDKNNYQATPNILLAKGDVIRMCVGYKAPANLICITDPSIKLQRGEVYNTKLKEKEELDLDLKTYFSDERGFKKFKVLETPIITEIQNLLDNIEEEEEKKPILLDQQKIICWRILNVILLISLV